jgi:hypothetical protein
MPVATFTTDILARIIDPDISQVSNSVGESSTKQYIVVTHPPLDLLTLPLVSVDGSLATFNTVGSGADYELRRVSSTQSVIKVKTFGAAKVYALVEDAPIGSAVIGSSFIIQ